MNRRRMMMGQSAAIDWSQEPFCIEVLDGTSFTVTYRGPDSYANFYYRPRGGDSWINQSLAKSTATTIDSLEPNTRYEVRVVGYESGTTPSKLVGFCNFLSSYNFRVSGNIMSLIDYYNFTSLTSISSQYQFSGLFSGAITLVSAENLVLPATSLSIQCYGSMFEGCTAMTKGPSSLPATTLASSCYYGMFDNCSAMTNTPELAAVTSVTSSAYRQMFYGCANITTAPSLPATSINTYCYCEMFRGCSNLVTGPTILPATTLKNYCYKGMFYGCSKLTNTPELPATSLVSNCYAEMFYGCSLVNSIKCLATSRAATNNTTNWVNGVAASGTFTKASSASFWGIGDSDIPTGWTVQNYGSSLPAGYTELQYVECDGQQYIDIPIYGNQNTTIKIKFRGSYSQYSHNGVLIGNPLDNSYTPPTGGIMASIYYADEEYNEFCLAVNFGNKQDDGMWEYSEMVPVMTLNTWFELEMSASGYTIKTNGTTVHTQTWSGTNTFTLSNYLRIGASRIHFYPSDNYIPYYGLIGEFEVNNLHFVPAIEPNFGTAGFYELTNGVFYDSFDFTGIDFISGPSI